MQGYIVLMSLLVLAGTVLDMLHKRSAAVLFRERQAGQKNAKRKLGGGEKAGLALKTVAKEVLTSAEFNTPNAAFRTCSPCTASYFSSSARRC